MSDTPKKLCFVISPIGADNSPERDAADWFLEIVREALGDNYRIERADALKKSGQITTQIIELIETADLIVADLTGHNPNVHYELGVAHARGKQVVPMMMKGDTLPFDNAQMRTVFYSRASPRDHQAAIRDLQARVTALTDHAQNPVTHALGALTLSQGDDKDQVIATVSAQVASHDTDIALLQKAFADLVHIVARGLPAHSTAALPPGNPYLNANPFNVLSAGGVFGGGGGLLSPSTEKSKFGDMFVTTQTEPKEK